MPDFPIKNREYLSSRHRLSHQQIDTLLNEKYAKNNIAEKLGQLFQVGEFMELTDAFREADIPFTPIKGPILSYKLHNDASLRYSHDLDFLMASHDIKKAIYILENKGYEPGYFPWPSNIIKEQRLIKRSNQILFSHPEHQISIELHWRLFGRNMVDSKVIDEVLKKNAESIKFNNRIFQGFNKELELLYLIIHGGLHGWFRLKWLVDIKDFLENTTINSKKFSQLVTKLNASRMVALCNATLAHYFPSSALLPCKEVPGTKKRLKFTISQIEKEDYYTRSVLERIEHFWFRFHCFPGIRYKWNILAGAFRSIYNDTFKFQRTF
ncbi:nucleotidyltransferase family protein [Aequorivita sediminis]|uniref:nucleotidyltransferase family protein n=1 Tax=Aequorivita sediminis TaxID=3073653 RepID=UPI0028AF3BB4|nr:nucleotidyltransferase family protein [Aequorivita sp. F6058]